MRTLRSSARSTVIHAACAAFVCVALFISPVYSKGKSESTTSVGSTQVSSTEIAKILETYPSGVSGEYVVYRDYSWKAPTWIGFLYYDDSTWGAFSFTPSTGSRVSVLFRTEEAEGQLILTGQQIISEIQQSDVPAVNYLMSLLPDVFSWRKELSFSGAKVRLETEDRGSLLPAGLQLSKNLLTFGGEVFLRFVPEVPVFNLASMTASDKNPILELARWGRVGNSGDSEFFSFEPTQQAIPKTAPSFSPGQSVREKRTVDGVELNLDGQWTMVADNTFFLGNTAVLIVDTLDLGLMEIPQRNRALSFVRLFSFSSSSALADPSKLHVSGTSDQFRIENLFFDVQSGTLNRDIKKCSLSADGKKCTVISLSVSDTSWKNNEAYFNALF